VEGAGAVLSRVDSVKFYSVDVSFAFRQHICEQVCPIKTESKFTQSDDMTWIDRKGNYRMGVLEGNDPGDTKTYLTIRLDIFQKAGEDLRAYEKELSKIKISHERYLNGRSLMRTYEENLEKTGGAP
jgi:hypothetical protein